MLGRLTSWLHGKKKAEPSAEAFSFKPEPPPVEKTPPAPVAEAAPEPVPVRPRGRIPSDAVENVERPRPQPFAPAVRPLPEPSPGQVAPAPAPSILHQPVETLPVPWAALVERWPDPVKQVLLAHGGAERVDFPLTVLGPALKRGKLVLPWRQVSQWVVPGSPALSRAIVGDTLLDIPFSVVAPLFLAARPVMAQQRQPLVSAQVPDLFASAAAAVPVAPIAAQPAPVPFTPAAVSPGTAPGDVLVVPWAALLDKWPDAIKQALAGRGPAAVHVPLAVVEPALKRGKLVVAWADLSKWASPGSASLASAMSGDTQVELPMSVMAPLFFAQGKARPVQRQTAVSAEVPDLFAAALPPKAQPAPAPISPASALAPSPSSRESAPPVVTAPLPSPPVEPPLEARCAPPALPPIEPLLIAPVPAVPAIAPAAQPGTPDALSFPLATLVATVAPAGALPHPTVAGSLRELALNCPDAATKAIAALGAAHWVELPLATLESALRGGRMVVSWRQLCDWVMPPAPSLAATVAPETPIEIPLRAVAGAYLALRAQASTGPRGGETSASSLVPPAEVRAAALESEQAVTTFKPGELLDRVCALPGIQGALLASDDGLVLAARLNSSLDADTMAAFLPKLMAPALESATLFRIGEPESVVYVFTGATIIAQRFDGLLLAAVGQPQQTLALDRLRAVLRHAKLG